MPANIHPSPLIQCSDAIDNLDALKQTFLARGWFWSARLDLARNDLADEYEKIRDRLDAQRT